MQTTKFIGRNSCVFFNTRCTQICSKKYLVNLLCNSSFHTTSFKLDEKDKSKHTKSVKAPPPEQINQQKIVVVKVPNSNSGTSGHVKALRNPPPEAPSNCCRSNCANCVWIQYALEITEYYKDGGTEALKFLDEVDDPALKAFLKMELKSKLQED